MHPPFLIPQCNPSRVTPRFPSMIPIRVVKAIFCLFVSMGSFRPTGLAHFRRTDALAQSPCDFARRGFLRLLTDHYFKCTVPYPLLSCLFPFHCVPFGSCDSDASQAGHLYIDLLLKKGLLHAGRSIHSPTLSVPPNPNDKKRVAFLPFSFFSIGWEKGRFPSSRRIRHSNIYSPPPSF